MEHDCGGGCVSPDGTPVDPPGQSPSSDSRKSATMQTEEEPPEVTGVAPERREIVNETIDIFLGKEFYIPHVEIEVEGIPVQFAVDTGTHLTSISRKQMAILGFEESDLSNLDESNLKYLFLNVRINDYEMQRLFIVRKLSNFHLNLLGLDILGGYSCIIDLDKDRLTFREYNDDALWDIPKTTVNIHGKDLEVEIDTAAGGYLRGTLSLAKELDLPLQPVQGKTIVGVHYEVPMSYAALDLCLKAFGREVHNAWFVVMPEEVPEDNKVPSLGGFFFYGMRLQFNMDGTFEVTEPTQGEETERLEDPRGEGEATGPEEEQRGSDERPETTDAEEPQKYEEEPAPPRGSDRGCAETAITGQPRGSDGVPATGEPQGSDGVPATGEPQGSDGVPATTATTGEPQGSDGVPATGEPQGSDGVPATGEPQGSDGVPATGEPQGSDGVPATTATTGEPQGSDREPIATGEPSECQMVVLLYHR
ncbi:uncharacterized protein LOC122267815 [Penaeus japonicus]|uniref:uncharacterized protein LOC122267815 n=1 Tax=Penaeus japonicus TaxID=27405 RepID=UPI001C70F14A|nr:uncharacterized protein LOC122267815 [Penaeus japonicus]XP_042893914.1 uncharacterized protein LOC122267815 [Penaeus japonicus]